MDWKTRESDGVVHADPHGMRWSYYIKPSESDKNSFELAYVEHNGDFQEHGKLFANIKDAQEIAKQHYKERVSANIVIE